MTQRSRWLSGLAAVALVLATASAAFGYGHQTPATVLITIGAVGEDGECERPVPVEVTVIQGSGQPVEGQRVTIGFEASVRGDTISGTTPTTNASGNAAATVVFVCRPGARVLFATAGDVRGRLVIREGTLGLTFGAVAGATGLPNTSTDGGSEIPILLTAAIAATGGTLLVRRHVLARR